MFRLNLRRSYSSSSFPFATSIKNDDSKQLILSILKQTTTKRETNTYLNKYQACFNESESLISPKRYIFIKIEGDLNQYDPEKLTKFNKTLDYIVKLGGSPILLLDSDHLLKSTNNFNQIDRYLSDQFNKLDGSIGKQLKLLPLRSSLTQSSDNTIEFPSSLMKDISAFNKIPVLFPIIYDSTTSRESLLPSTKFLTNFVKLVQSKIRDDSTVEKILFIDKFGGIPSLRRSNDSHVFVNLKQEYQSILNELESNSHNYQESHLSNLNAMSDVLNAINNDNSTGLITTLDIAIENLDLNPIIYNILTDRSLVSSSLSPVKFKSNNNLVSKISKTTILKKGIDLTVYTSIDQIDLKRFKKLIDDSFKRSINLDHYLNRIRDKVSQIIIIGDYEGIALITNETSTVTGDTYAYLDKFAVLRSKQGSLGVADIIFNQMLRIYEGEFLIWRSKKNNPVNGWYFQRSNGSFNLQDSDFRLFWNGLDRKFDQNKFNSFVDIVKNIKPSWDK